MAETVPGKIIRQLSNEQAQSTLPDAVPDRAPLAFHQQLPGYAPSPLRAAPAIAATLGVGQVWVKDESSRFGLPAFKILGASWATYRVILAHLGLPADTTISLDDLRTALASRPPLTLAAATDGNHGRAVARVARWLGCRAQILVPDDMAAARREAIASEGATVLVQHGTYDDAVAAAATLANDQCLVIADTAWDGYETVPRWVIDGYATILWETDDQLAAQHAAAPDLVAVQIGVGALAAAVTRHFRQPDHPQPTLVGVEPGDAACVLASVAAGGLTAVPGPHRSIMAGLNCGLPSTIALPVLRAGIDLFLAVNDDAARVAMRTLAASGIIAGETGAAGLGGLLALSASDRAALGLTPHSSVLVFNTEGATDPVAYAEIVGQQPAPIGHR